MRCAVPIKNRQNQRFNALCAAAEKDKINVECTVCSKGRKKDFIKKNRRNKNKNVWFSPGWSRYSRLCNYFYRKKNNNYFHIFGKY